MSDLQIEWRGAFSNDELNVLHAEAFDHAVLDVDWEAQLQGHSLGWVTARHGAGLVGFVNVAWDGGVHAFLVDTIVEENHRRRGVATAIVARAVQACREAGCEWLHVDFDDDLRPLYFDACGFQPTNAGLIAL